MVSKLENNRFKVTHSDGDKYYNSVDLMKYLIRDGYKIEDVIVFGISLEEMREITINQLLDKIN